jgi:hypothetical protein
VGYFIVAEMNENATLLRTTETCQLAYIQTDAIALDVVGEKGIRNRMNRGMAMPQWSGSLAVAHLTAHES